MIRKLSLPMKEALRSGIRTGEVRANKSTTCALEKRKLINLNKRLTEAGERQAIVLLPLSEQCEKLAIKYETLDLHIAFNRPEITAWEYFKNLGFIGSYCEAGPILLMIRAAALDLLASTNVFASREDACMRFTEAQLIFYKNDATAIISDIKKASPENVVANFQEIYAYSLVKDFYPGLDASVIRVLFESLGADRLSLIASAIIEDPYTYRSGWPDLIMSKDNMMLWVEIKTTDKLHLKQIVTLSRMKEILPGSLKVIKIQKG